MIKLGAFETDAPWVRVIGLARNAALNFESDPDLRPNPAVYVLGGPGNPYAGGEVVVRVAGDDPKTLLGVRRAIEGAVTDFRGSALIRPWLGDFDGVVTGRRFVTALFGVLGVFALILAAVGLYSVLAYAVSQRMREFGVRMALGAGAPDLLKLVMHDGFVMTLAGTGAGAILAMWAAKLLSYWLYNVGPTDVGSLVLAEAVLFVVSLIACAVPALTAMRADPIEILRAT